jgi:ribosomal protein L37AE/L43A
MKIQQCPRCQQDTMASNGAFWACASCGYAITEVALLAEQQNGSANWLTRARPGAADERG